MSETRSDDHAFERGVYWIKTLMPTLNKNEGGRGGRVRPKRKPRISREDREYQVVGPRRYAARFLCRKLDESNIQSYGVSKVVLDRIREVASGPWC